MKLFVAVLIAAVTVNCLVTAINGETANDTAAVPYIDMLLPPFEDVQDNSKDVVTKNKVTVKVTPVPTTTITKKTTTTTTTQKPITNEVNNILPELSIEALLPPLFEAKIEQEETKTTTTQTPTTTTATTTRGPTTTTTKTSITAKPLTTTTAATIVKPSKLELPDLFLDSLLPPLLDNDIIDVKDETVASTTQKPILSFKTTKKSYYQQLKHLQTSNRQEAKNYNKPAATSSDAAELVAESKTQTKQVPLVSHKQNNKLQRKIDTMAKQHEAKKVTQQRHSVGNSQHEAKQFNNNNYSFDLYFGSTTARPPKSGLPTITPFPHRLGR